MKVTSHTIKNTKRKDKPNEDYVFFDFKKNIFILLDGVTRDIENDKYPNPSPAVEAVNILKKEIYNNLKNYIFSKNIIIQMQDAISMANKKLKIYNDKYNLDFNAGAVGIVAVIFNNKFYYAYIGDCYGRIIYKNEISFFTECQTKLISIHKKEFTSLEIRNEICNNISHPYGYGVLNGDNNALQFLCSGEIELTNVKYIILSSDGMEPFLSKCNIDLIKNQTALQLANNSQQYNNINQDDKTILKIEI